MRDGGRIYKARLMVDGRHAYADAVKYEDRLWLVPNWLEFPAVGKMQPLRMIALDGILHQENWSGVRWQILVSLSLPQALFEKGASAATVPGFRVVETPPILFDIPAE